MAPLSLLINRLSIYPLLLLTLVQDVGLANLLGKIIVSQPHLRGDLYHLVTGLKDKILVSVGAPLLRYCPHPFMHSWPLKISFGHSIII
jgi:hypothetical protein